MKTSGAQETKTKIWIRTLMRVGNSEKDSRVSPVRLGYIAHGPAHKSVVSKRTAPIDSLKRRSVPSQSRSSLQALAFISSMSASHNSHF
jgi:hypothetical protein